MDAEDGVEPPLTGYEPVLLTIRSFCIDEHQTHPLPIDTLRGDESQFLMFYSVVFRRSRIASLVEAQT